MTDSRNRDALINTLLSTQFWAGFTWGTLPVFAASAAYYEMGGKDVGEPAVFAAVTCVAGMGMRTLSEWNARRRSRRTSGPTRHP